MESIIRYLENTIKRDLVCGRKVVGSWISIPCLETTDIMASAFDFLVIDAEHSVIDLEMIQKMNMVIEGRGKFPFVRVADTDLTTIKRTLETGCYGIILPNINTKSEAEAAIEGIFYKPKGVRGAGLSRAQQYGLSFNEYISWYERNLCIIVQIESVEAVSNLHEILAVEGIDGSMLGPYDLSASLGCPGDFTNSKMQDVFRVYESISVDTGIPAGWHIVHPNEQELKDKASLGYSFLLYGVDQMFLSTNCLSASKAISSCKELQGK